MYAVRRLIRRQNKRNLQLPLPGKKSRHSDTCASAPVLERVWLRQTTRNACNNLVTFNPCNLKQWSAKSRAPPYGK